jgi:hypothetical protein
MVPGSSKERDQSFSDERFAQAIDALLWVSPSEDPDNSENFRAVKWWLEERGEAIAKLDTLVAAAVRAAPWRDHPELAAPLLEALLFVEWVSGNREDIGQLFGKGETVSRR